MFDLENWASVAILASSSGVAVGAVISVVSEPYRRRAKLQRLGQAPSIGRKMLAKVSTKTDWAMKFEEGRTSLAAIVNSGDELDAKTALETQAALLDYFQRPIPGFEAVTYPLQGLWDFEELKGMHLTHVYHEDHRSKGFTGYEMIPPRRCRSKDEVERGAISQAYINNLKDLAAKAGSEFANDETLHSDARNFAREHAAHLLLNYRTSAEVALIEEGDFLRKAAKRQEHLDLQRRYLSKAFAGVISQEVTNQDPATTALLEAKRVAATLVASEVAPVDVPTPSDLPNFSIADSADWTDEHFTAEEQGVVEAYRKAFSTLDQEEQVVAESLLGKLFAAAALARKAENFSSAGKAHALSLADHNRALVIAELGSIVKPVLSAEENEAIYALRVDNKYLLARTDHREETSRVGVQVVSEPVGEPA